jgi:hypothetical protein
MHHTTEPLPELWSAAAIHDPYPIYDRLRADQPIRWTGGDWQIFRYATLRRYSMIRVWALIVCRLIRNG